MQRTTSHFEAQTKPQKKRGQIGYHTKKQSTSEDELWKLSNDKHTKPVNGLAEAWKYKGDALIAEKIAFDCFIDLKLNKFDDLVRLNDNHMGLYEKCS